VYNVKASRSFVEKLLKGTLPSLQDTLSALSKDEEDPETVQHMFTFWAVHIYIYIYIRELGIAVGTQGGRGVVRDCYVTLVSAIFVFV